MLITLNDYNDFRNLVRSASQLADTSRLINDTTTIIVIWDRASQVIWALYGPSLPGRPVYRYVTPKPTKVVPGWKEERVEIAPHHDQSVHLVMVDEGAWMDWWSDKYIGGLNDVPNIQILPGRVSG